MSSPDAVVAVRRVLLLLLPILVLCWPLVASHCQAVAPHTAVHVTPQPENPDHHDHCREPVVAPVVLISATALYVTPTVTAACDAPAVCRTAAAPVRRLAQLSLLTLLCVSRI